MAPYFCLFLLLVSSHGLMSDEVSRSFTGFANLEKLYTLEDELITVADVILKQEMALHDGADVHNISSISSTIERVKDIHQNVMNSRNMTSYIVHPINIYHMTKRLVREWAPVIQTLDGSKSCAKEMRAKVENIADNIPKEEHLQNVRESIVNLQALFKIPARDLISGEVMGNSALSPLSLDDAFEMGHAAYNTNEFEVAVDWFQLLLENYSEDAANFTKKSALSLLSSAYFMSGRSQEAINTLDAVLSIDPDNRSAQRNKRFIEKKMSEKDGDGRTGANRQEKKKITKLVEDLCVGNVKVDLKKQSKLFCTYVEDRDSQLFSLPSNAAEVLSLKPLIILFHNMTTHSQQRAVSHLGYEKMKNTMFKNRYSHPEGIESMVVYDQTHWQWIPKVEQKLLKIKLTDFKPDTSQFMVQNVGMGGFKSTSIMQYRGYRLGTFLVFLSETKYGGGNVVFPYANVRAEPTKGGVLFYDKKAHNQAHICPVLADTLWVGTYPLVDNLKKTVCQSDPIRRPKRH